MESASGGPTSTTSRSTDKVKDAKPSTAAPTRSDKHEEIRRSSYAPVSHVNATLRRYYGASDEVMDMLWEPSPSFHTMLKNSEKHKEEGKAPIYAVRVEDLERRPFPPITHVNATLRDYYSASDEVMDMIWEPYPVFHTVLTGSDKHKDKGKKVTFKS